MTREEIIDGLEFTVEMFMFDPSTGVTYKEPRNDMDKTTIDACRGAIELLKKEAKALERINSLGLKDELSTIDDFFDEMKHCNFYEIAVAFTEMSNTIYDLRDLLESDEVNNEKERSHE